MHFSNNCMHAPYTVAKQAKKMSKWADLAPYRFKVIPCIVLGAVGYSDQSEQELQIVLIG